MSTTTSTTVNNNIANDVARSLLTLLGYSGSRYMKRDNLGIHLDIETYKEYVAILNALGETPAPAPAPEHIVLNGVLYKTVHYSKTITTPQGTISISCSVGHLPF